MLDGPHLVILTTPMVAKLQGVGIWLHLSQLKTAPDSPPAKYSCQAMGPLNPKLLIASGIDSFPTPAGGPLCLSAGGQLDF